jgi:hypothetical protein
VRDDKSLMGVERVSSPWNSSALFPKYGCVGNWIIKPPLRLALIYDWTIITKYKRKCYNSWSRKNLPSKQGRSGVGLANSRLANDFSIGTCTDSQDGNPCSFPPTPWNFLSFLNLSLLFLSFFFLLSISLHFFLLIFFLFFFFLY